MKGDKVATEELLYRRGYNTPEKNYLNPDGTATSRVFKVRQKDYGRLSVDVASLTTPAASLIDPSKFILFEIPNANVEAIGLQTLHDPSSNPAHALIMTIEEDDEITPGLLARKSRRVAV